MYVLWWVVFALLILSDSDKSMVRNGQSLLNICAKSYILLAYPPAALRGIE